MLKECHSLHLYSLHLCVLSLRLCVKLPPSILCSLLLEGGGDDGRKPVDHVRSAVVADLAAAGGSASGVDELPQPGRAGHGSQGAGDWLSNCCDRAHRAGLGRSANSAAVGTV